MNTSSEPLLRLLNSDSTRRCCLIRFGRPGGLGQYGTDIKSSIFCNRQTAAILPYLRLLSLVLASPGSSSQGTCVLRNYFVGLESFHLQSGVRTLYDGYRPTQMLLTWMAWAGLVETNSGAFSMRGLLVRLLDTISYALAL